MREGLYHFKYNGHEGLPGKTFEQKPKGKEGTNYTDTSGKTGYVYDSVSAFIGHSASYIPSPPLSLPSLFCIALMHHSAYSNNLFCPHKFPIFSFSWLASGCHLGELSVTSPPKKMYLCLHPHLFLSLFICGALCAILQDPWFPLSLLFLTLLFPLSLCVCNMLSINVWYGKLK